MSDITTVGLNLALHLVRPAPMTPRADQNLTNETGLQMDIPTIPM